MGVGNKCGKGAKVQRFKGAEVQRCKGAEVQSGKGAKVKSGKGVGGSIAREKFENILQINPRKDYF